MKEESQIQQQMVTQGMHTLSQILEYNQKIKELEIRKAEMQRKYKSMDNAIESIKSIEIKEIEEQSNRLKEILKTTSDQIKNNSIERKVVLNEIKVLNQRVINPNYSLEEKQMCLTLIKIQTGLLRDIGENGIKTIHELAQTTQKAITASNEKRAKFNIPSTLKYLEE